MLLAIDCSTQLVGLALYDGSQVVAEMSWRSLNHHTVELSPAIHNLMLRCGVPPAQLSGMAVALGPGSFTSIRIGLAVVKGMVMALHIPVIGIPTLDILAAAQPLMEIPMAAVLSAGRERLAVGWYDVQDGGWKPRNEASIMTVESLTRQIHHPTYVCGELSAAGRQALARKYKNVLLASPATSLRRPAFLAEMAWRRLQAGKTDDVALLAPIYLRVADIP
jgi:tRNA threonylcarbamoyladenosine biosynthesis protein TsaB